MPTPSFPLEFVARDGAWYAGTPSFSRGSLSVHFQDFPDTEDELWDPCEFQSLEAVKEVIRPASQPLQDDQCTSISEGMILCVACRRPRSACFEYYDAKVVQVKRLKHSIGRDKQERCHCQFQVVWLAGRQKGKNRFVACGDICILMPGNIQEVSDVRAFLKKVEDCKTGGTVSKPDDEDRLDKYVTRISKKSKTSPSRPKKECHGQTAFAKRSYEIDGERKHEIMDTENGRSNMEATPLEPNMDENERSITETAEGTSAKENSSQNFSNEVASFPGGALNSTNEASPGDGSAKEICEDYTLDQDLGVCEQVSGSLPQTRVTVSEMGAGKCTDVSAGLGNSDDGNCDLRADNGSRLEIVDAASRQEENTRHVSSSDVSTGARCKVTGDEDEGKMDQLTNSERCDRVEASATSKAIPDIEIIDVDSEEDADVPPSHMDGDHRVPGPMMQDASEMFSKHMTSSINISSGLPDLNKPEPNTIARSSICIDVHNRNQIPSMSALPSQTSDDRDNDLVLESPRGVCTDLNHEFCNAELHSTTHTNAGLSERDKIADTSSVDRLHFKCPSRSLPEAGKCKLEDKIVQLGSKPGHADESGRKDCSHNCGLHKEDDHSEYCVGHICSCSCIAFQGCRKNKTSHDCCHVRFVHMGPLHMQRHICCHATSCICEGQNQCHCRDDLRCSGNSTWTRCHSASSERSLGGKKRGYSQLGHDSKGRPQVDGTGKADEQSKEVKIHTSSQFLLIENLERDVTPTKALKIVKGVSFGAVMVYIWPILEYETVRKAYICYQDSQAADIAHSTFLGDKFLIVSSKRRPWVISRANLDLADLRQLSGLNATATLKEDNDSGDVEDEGLSILYHGTQDYFLALAKKKLFLEQRRELRLCFKRFSKEDEESEENLGF